MQTDDRVVLVNREYNDGSIMVNKFDSIDQAIKFKDRWANLNESNIDYHTLETTALVSNVSEMIDLLDKYEKNMFDLIRQKNIESERKWTALGAFNKIRDEWVNESRYVEPVLTFFMLIYFFGDLVEGDSYKQFIGGGIWVGVSYAFYRVQKFFIYRKTRGVFDDFND